MKKTSSIIKRKKSQKIAISDQELHAMKDKIANLGFNLTDEEIRNNLSSIYRYTQVGGELILKQKNGKNVLELNPKYDSERQDHKDNYIIRDFSDKKLNVILEKPFFINEKNKTISPSKIKLLKLYADIVSGNAPLRSLYIYGDTGVGKTYATIAFTNHLTKSGVKVAFCFVPELVHQFKMNFNKDSSYNNEIINALKRVPLLVLDDLGAEQTSLWFYNEYLLLIMNYRCENNLPTIFTSNLGIDEFGRKMAMLDRNNAANVKRIKERIKGLVKDQEIKLEDINFRY